MDEYSFGCIPFRYDAQGTLLVLLVLHCEGHWSLPKGHKEEEETHCDTALRELKEETGLDGTVVSDTPLKEHYEYTRASQTMHKTVRYYLTEVADSDVELQKSELTNFVWLPFLDAVQQATYDTTRDVLCGAQKSLAQLNNRGK